MYENLIYEDPSHIRILAEQDLCYSWGLDDEKGPTGYLVRSAPSPPTILRVQVHMKIKYLVIQSYDPQADENLDQLRLECHRPLPFCSILGANDVNDDEYLDVASGPVPFDLKHFQENLPLFPMGDWKVGFVHGWPQFYLHYLYIERQKNRHNRKLWHDGSSPPKAPWIEIRDDIALELTDICTKEHGLVREPVQVSRLMTEDEVGYRYRRYGTIVDYFDLEQVRDVPSRTHRSIYRLSDRLRLVRFKSPRRDYLPGPVVYGPDSEEDLLPIPNPLMLMRIIEFPDNLSTRSIHSGSQSVASQLLDDEIQAHDIAAEHQLAPPVVGLVTEEGRDVIGFLMEWIPDASTLFDVRLTATLLRSVRATFHQLHEIGVQHGEPTRSNVLVDSKGKVWLVDFEFANVILISQEIRASRIREVLEWEDPIFLGRG